ncbi:MAG: PmoA family protein [Planctomycetota bacterium]
MQTQTLPRLTYWFAFSVLLLVGTHALADKQAKQLTLADGDRPILSYNVTTVPSPIEDAPWFSRSGFIHPVYSPEGRVVTDPFPADHPHQHGLMFAWTSSEYEGQKVDFWNAKKKQGKIEHVKTIQADANTIKVELRHKIIGGKHKGTTVLNETWTVTRVEHDTLNIFDLVSVQTCATDKPLTVNKHKYGAMCIRGPARWSTGDAMLTSEGKSQKEGNHTRPDWVALFGEAVRHGETDTQLAGIAAMAHPDNKHGPQPVRLHPEMSYFCFAPMIHDGFQIKPGEPFISKFRFVTYDGKPDPKTLDAIWKQYASPAKKTN